MKKINSIVYYISLLIFYVAAIYRLAILIVVDDGPLKIFDIIRKYPEKYIFKDGRRLEEDDFPNKDEKYKQWYKWNSFYDGINCTDCVGVWSGFILAPILALAMKYQIVGLIIFALGGAGFQHYITNRDNGEDELIV